MSFYDQTPSWSQQPARQSSWEQQQQAPPSRSASVSASVSGMSSPPPPEVHGAFSAQFEEIDRATDNLTKGGKWFPGALSSPQAGAPPQRRHEPSAAAMGRGYDNSYGQSSGGGAAGSGDARMGHSGQSRNSSVSEYDGGRSNSASGLQGFYQGQRFPGPRQSEAEQMLQAKRRMAAQRERELRNYHQEQQYNRNVSGVKGSSSSTPSTNNPSDRALSPSTNTSGNNNNGGGMSEEDRRELIARQHRALYGDNSTLYSPSSESAPSPLGQNRRESSSQDVRVASAASNARGASPMAYGEVFGVPSASSQEGQGGAPVTMPARDGASPAAEVASASSNSPPSGLQGQKGVAPIGTRPPPGVGPQGMGGKRSTTPLTPSSLSYGFSSSEQQGQQAPPSREERGSVSAAGYGGGWGMGGKGAGVQASVWG